MDRWIDANTNAGRPRKLPKLKGWNSELQVQVQVQVQVQIRRYLHFSRTLSGMD
jgi:hypothetical protein